ncbi:hypothetical protein DSL64_03665 [Dyadobacter luteus]|uniref:Uncharacterized protein n=1 Tax=Dyadobacter luteus TaxID=2259619 RepID=A0A3D8YFW7_9BACT|nr:hypothetical protein DSL64_03665 [Dyadobacter luteus]
MCAPERTIVFFIITSQLPVSKWHEVTGEKTIADYHHFFIMRCNLILCLVRQAIKAFLVMITSHNFTPLVSSLNISISYSLPFKIAISYAIIFL